MEDLELDVDVTLPIFIQLNVKRESEKDWLETSRWVKFQVREKKSFQKVHIQDFLVVNTIRYTFLSNRNVHKSSCGLYFWVPGSLIDI